MSRSLTLSLLALLASAGTVLLPAAAVEAQCTGDEAFCAEVQVGGGFHARARIGRAARRAQVVVVQPAPVPPPPPVAAPPVVVVQPNYQPQPAPQVVVTTQAQAQPAEVVVVRRELPPTNVGFHWMIGGAFGDDLSMAGGRLGVRFRPGNGHFGLDLGVGAYWGSDYNGLSRAEVPLTLDGLFFFNPRSRWQFYSLLGIGGSWAETDAGYNVNTGEWQDRRGYTYFGGELGLGIEWRIARRFALNLDVRGFLRWRVDGNPVPEFREMDYYTGTWRSTDTSGGVTTNFGGTWYW